MGLFGNHQHGKRWLDLHFKIKWTEGLRWILGAGVLGVGGSVRSLWESRGLWWRVIGARRHAEKERLVDLRPILELTSMGSPAFILGNTETLRDSPFYTWLFQVLLSGLKETFISSPFQPSIPVTTPQSIPSYHVDLLYFDFPNCGYTLTIPPNLSITLTRFLPQHLLFFHIEISPPWSF